MKKISLGNNNIKDQIQIDPTPNRAPWADFYTAK